MTVDLDRLENVPRVLPHNMTTWDWISLHFMSNSNTRLSRYATIRESHSHCSGVQCYNWFFSAERRQFLKFLVEIDIHLEKLRLLSSCTKTKFEACFPADCGHLTSWEFDTLVRAVRSIISCLWWSILLHMNDLPFNLPRVVGWYNWNPQNRPKGALFRGTKNPEFFFKNQLKGSIGIRNGGGKSRFWTPSWLFQTP